METCCLHFDLSTHDSRKEFFIQGHGKKEKLASYADHPYKRIEHQISNLVLGLIPDSHQHRITHFIEGITLPDDRISRLSIITPAENHTDLLPDLISVHFHIPQAAYKRALELAGHGCTPHPLVLIYLGIHEQQLTESNHVEVKAAAALTILPPLANAQSIVFHHPEIGSIDKTTAANVYAKYMQNQNDFDQLVNYISNNPFSSGNPWYNKTYSIMVDPETMQESPAPPTNQKFADGKQMDWPTDPTSGKPVIPQYQLSDDTTGAPDGGVLAAATTAVFSVLKQTKNDASLGGGLWTRSQATVSQKQSSVSPAPLARPSKVQLARKKMAAPDDVALGDVADFWSVKYDSNRQYGLDIYASDIAFNNNTLSFPVKNWPNRYLGVYVEYQLEDGTPISWSTLKNSKEGKNLVQPDGFVSDAFALVYAKQDDTTTKLFWGILSSGNNVFGIPFPTNSVDINFQWPHDPATGAAMASRVEIYIGGLGVANGFSDWDSDLDMAGLVSTGIMNYGITAASMVFSVMVIGPMKNALMKSQAKYAVLTLAIHLGVVAVIVSSFFWENATAKTILAKISNFAAGFVFGSVSGLVAEIIYKEAIEEICASAVTNLTTQEALEQIPYAGWVLKVISLSSDIASLAATTIECLASPATYKLQVQETMDLTVTLKPDPRHGTNKQQPIWPMVADHWVIQLVYPQNGKFQGGTTFVQAGPMPGQHADPIVITFEKVPAGGQIELLANVYSESDWIVGGWQSGPKDATPDAKGQLAYGGAITENLVPLTPTTTYSEKQRVGFDPLSQKHQWIVTAFSIDAGFKSDLQAGQLGVACRLAFANNGIQLPEGNAVTVQTVAEGIIWSVIDNHAHVTYQCTYQQIYSRDGAALYEISVQNNNRPAPSLPNPKTVCDTSGGNHNLCHLVGMTINNKAYQLGYAWRASGMNMPMDKSSNPVQNIQMYALQSISTLNEPSDLILQSKLGFSQMPFIAYDQFGLTPLFFIDFATYRSALNATNGQAVPVDLVAVFTGKGFTITTGTLVKVIKVDFEWRFADISGNVLFDLIQGTTVVNGNIQSIINIYNYVVPESTNFYMDPRSGPNGYYHLRAVSFNDGIPGSYNFEVDFDSTQANSWGAFPIPNGSTLYQMAVHPGGYVVAIDYGLDKLWMLRLPGTATTMANAPLAMPLSGSGQLEGLLNQPKAMTIASDGRIIILEQGNTRLQSFDISGNPVASFKGPLLVTFPNALIGTLNSGSVQDDLRKAYQTLIPSSFLRNPLFTEYDNAPVADLDKGIMDAALITYFKNHVINLPTDPGSVSVLVNEPGAFWLVTDNTTGVTFDIRWDNTLYALNVGYAANLQIEVVAAGVEWKLADRMNSLTFDVKPGAEPGDPLTAQQLISTATLRQQTGVTIEYLDIAVEDKGYIYVLYFQDPGTSANQFMLDIYNPDGSVLLDRPLTGLAAAKMAVDQWRTLWTLNYETFLGPDNRTEPSVSGWIPSTPDSPTPGS